MKSSILLALSVALAGVLAACGNPPPPRTAVAHVATGAAPPDHGVSVQTARIDAQLEAAWKTRALVPASAADDATFLRRVTLDLTGTIPTTAEVQQYLADVAPDKKGRAIDRLLASPEYVEHWTNYWDAALLGLKVSNRVDRAAFRAWLRERIAANTPWDQLVFELLTAEGASSPGGSKKDRAVAVTGEAMPGDRAVSAPVDVDDRGDRQSAGVNGAVNFVLKFLDAPADYPSTVSRVFLGVQIQCAQCHDHKTEAWKQTDFQKLAAGALHFKSEALGDAKMNAAQQVFEVKDAAKIFPRVAKDPDNQAIAKARPTGLDGVVLAKGDKTREAFAAWITAKDSPYFARAYVNRIWGHLLGRGFVDPVDDIRPSNPPQAPEVFDLVTKEFSTSGYDPKRLLGMLARTRAYGLAAARAKTSAGAPKDIELYSSFRLVPLGPTELLGALSRATSFDAANKKQSAQAKLNLVRSFQTLFDVDEEFDTDDFEGSLAQALTLLNGGTLASATSAAKGTALADILAQNPGEDARIGAIYLRALSRPVTPAELARAKAFLAGARTAAGKKGEPQIYGDLLFVLLNSSEFFFNH